MWNMRGQAWPFEWVSSERRAVRDHVPDDPAYPGLAVCGGPGLGKTSLARRWWETSEGGLWFSATESSREIPFGVFDRLAGTHSDSTLGVMRDARAAIAERGPGVRLVVDDAHHLDPVSATFLHHLVVEQLALVVVTVRLGARVGDAVRMLWKDDLLTRIELRPFTREETAHVCIAALGADVEPASLDRLYATTRGNPLFLRHLVENAVESGAFRPVDGRWRLTGDGRIGDRLDDLIAAELDSLSPAAREAATIVALGEPVRPGELLRIADATAVDEAEEAGIIVLADGAADEPSVRMRHPLVGEHLRAHLGEIHARRLRGRLVRVGLEDERPQDATRIALLSLASDRPVPPDLILGAARRAVTLGDLVTGERLARAAYERGGSFDAAIVLAHAMSWQGRGPEAEALLAGIRPEPGPQVVAWAVPRVANRFWTMHDAPGARTILREIVPQLIDPRHRATIDAMDAAMALHEGELDRASALAGEVLARVDAPPVALVWSAGTLAVCFGLIGRGADVEPLIARAEPLRDGFDTGFVGLSLDLGIAITGMLTGHWTPHPPSFEMQRRQAPVEGTVSGMIALCEGLAEASTGQLERGATTLTRAARLLERADATGWFTLALIAQVDALATLGRIDEAAAVLQRIDEQSHRAHRVLDGLVMLAHSTGAAARGEVSTAIALARRAARHSAAHRQSAVTVVALHQALRMGDTSVAGELLNVVARCDGDLPLAMAMHADALSRHAPRTLVEVSASFERLGAPVLALDAAVDAAEEYARMGDAAAEYAVRRRVDELDTRLGRVSTVAIRRHRRPLPLTTREREIARLVGDAMSNREIAGRLGLSIRTIEGHVYHVCRKLGLPNKIALAEARIDANE